MIGKSSLGTTIKLVVVASSKIEYNPAIKMRTSWACSHGWIASPAQRKTCLQAQNKFWNLFVAQGQSWCPILTQLPVIHNPTLGADQTIWCRSREQFNHIPQGGHHLAQGGFTCIPHASQITRGDRSGTPGLSTRSESGTQEPSTTHHHHTRKTHFMGLEPAPTLRGTPPPAARGTKLSLAI